MASTARTGNLLFKHSMRIPPGNEARCLRCKAVLTYEQQKARRRHPDVYQSYRNKCQAAKTSAQVTDASKVTPSVQPSVAKSIRPKMTVTASKAKVMTKLVAQFITRGMHLHRIVQEGAWLFSA